MNFLPRLAVLAGLHLPLLLDVTAVQAGETAALAQTTAAEQNDSSAPSPGRERLELGVAVDSDEGLTGSLYAGKNNLLPGIFTFGSYHHARETQRGQAGFFRPDAFGKDIDAGIDLNYRHDAYDDQGYRTTNSGIEPYLQFKSKRWGTLTTALGYRSLKLDGVAADAPPSFHKEKGSEDGLYLRMSYTLSKVVDTEKTQVSVSTDNHIYNLGSGEGALFQTENTVRTEFVIVPGELSLLNHLRFGYMHGIGGGAPGLADRFFIGGANLRGFEARRVGPYEGAYFIGGERYVTASFELIKQMGRVWGSPMAIGAFIDVGSLWGVSSQTETQADTSAILRSSAGLSMTMSLAGVPVSLYVAKPIKKEKQDEEQNFGMSVSMQF
jgi:outer membrane protein insertion porin family